MFKAVLYPLELHPDAVRSSEVRGHSSQKTAAAERKSAKQAASAAVRTAADQQQHGQTAQKP